MDIVQFNASVCNVIQMIPPRRVTTCAHIAELLGEPTKAGRVSEVVKLLGQSSSPLPWHRVTAIAGIIASRDGLGRAQRKALEREGVYVFTGLYGETRVKCDRFGWFPDHAPAVSDRFRR